MAPWVKEMLAADHESFYTYHGMMPMVYSPWPKAMCRWNGANGCWKLNEIRRHQRALAENDVATLFTMGDGVLLLEFHSKMNIFNTEVMAVLQSALEKLHGDAVGLVIANEGINFSAGPISLVWARWHKRNSGPS
ncbi:MAG: hypothetical protein R2867_05115 [Caldilineaceae bacterium]